MSILGASVGGSAINAAASIANAQNSWSNSNGSSWNSGGGYSYGSGISDSESYGIGDSYGYGASEGYSRTFGREASAQDIQNAREANQVQRDLWSMQADYNAKQAQIDREYQTYMSNTAYQRAVIDLLSAGLNPILAVGNMGASTPVGAMASSGLASANKANAYAEQTSYNSAYNYNESHERSGSKSHSESSNYGSEWNSGGSTQTSQSETTTQLKELSNIIRDLTKGGSAKTNTGLNQKQMAILKKNNAL